MKSIKDEFNWDPKQGPKLDFNEDYYSVLEVNPPPSNIDSKVLKKAYYKMVFKYHPDNKEGDDAKSLCNKQMMVINAAYKILKNDKLRNDYNVKRSMGFYGAKANIKESKNDDAKRTTTSSSSTSSSSSSKTTSSSSSSYASDNKNNNYQNASKRKDSYSTYNNNNDNNAYKNVESMVDVLSDLWSDIRDTGGSTIFEDVLDFLEDNFDSDKDLYSSKPPVSTSNQEQLNSEMSMIKLTIKNLKSHSTTLMKQCQDQEIDLKSTKGKELKTVEEMENRFRKIEDLKSLQARINEVEKQIKQLERQLYKKENRKRNLSEENYQSPFSSNKIYDNETSYKATENNQISIDYELRLLKKKMGL